MRALAALVLFGAIASCISREASAQTITIKDRDKLPRLASGTKTSVRRPASLMPEAINRKDCTDDLTLRFDLTLAGIDPAGVVESWVADERADCVAPQNRTGEAASCWKLASVTPVLLTTTIDAPMRKILASVSPFTVAKPAINDEACGKIDRTTLNVWFLYFGKDAVDVPAATARVAIVTDTIGPPAPTNIRLDRGPDFRIIATWDLVPTTTSDLTSTQAFCAVNEGLADAGTCATSVLVAGTIATRTVCGVASGAAAVRMTVNEATKGPAAIALASVDGLGNTGPLSEPVCVAPKDAAPPSDDGCASRSRSISHEGTIALACAVGLVRAYRRRCERSQRRSKGPLASASTGGGASGAAPHV